MRPTTRPILTLALAGALFTGAARADMPPGSFGGSFDLGTGGFSGSFTTLGGSAGSFNDPYAGYAGTYTTYGGNAGSYVAPGTGTGGTSVVVACAPTGAAGNVSAGGANSGAIAGSTGAGTTGAGTTGSGNAAGADLGTGNPANPGVCPPVVNGDDQGGHKCAVSTPGRTSDPQSRVVGVMLLLGLGALWLERRRR